MERVAKPNMDLIIQKGAYQRAFVGGLKGTYNQTPTISAPGYNNLLTGTWSNKHHVVNNSIKAPNYQYWSIFRYLKNQDASKKTAIFSSWQDNRTKLIGEGLKETGGDFVDFVYDGYEWATQAGLSGMRSGPRKTRRSKTRRPICNPAAASISAFLC